MTLDEMRVVFGYGCAAALWIACSGEVGVGRPGSSGEGEHEEADADADADVDGDSDADTDADGDVDADSDADADGDVDLGPCPPDGALDVRTFGAACDGATDDAAAIQAALDAAVDGQTVVIPCMAAIATNGLSLVGKTGVTLQGCGDGTGILAQAAVGRGYEGFNPALIVVEDCVGCTIRDFEVDVAGHDVGGLGVAYCTETAVQRVFVHDIGYACCGIGAAGNVRNRYESNTVLRTGTGSFVDDSGEEHFDGTRGMWLGNAWDAALEREPTITDNTVREAGGTGIASHVVSALYARNTSEDNLGAGIKSVPDPVETPDAPTIVEDNVLRRNLFAGLQLSQFHDGFVRRNLVEENHNSGIYCEDSGLRDVEIAENTIRNNETAVALTGWQGAIQIRAGDGVVVRDNVIEDDRAEGSRTMTNGIWLLVESEPLSNVEIVGNTITGGTVDGIRFQPRHAVSSVRVERNTVTGFGGHGVGFDVHEGGSVDDVMLCGNDLDDNGAGAIGGDDVTNDACQ